MKIAVILEFALVALCILGNLFSGTNLIISFLIYFIYQFIFKRFCYLRLIRDTISSHI